MTDRLETGPVRIDGRAVSQLSVPSVLATLATEQWLDNAYMISAAKKAVVAPANVFPGGRMLGLPAVLRGMVAYDHPELRTAAYKDRESILAIEKEGLDEVLLAVQGRAFTLRGDTVVHRYRTFPYTAVALEPGHELTLFVRRNDLMGDTQMPSQASDQSLHDAYNRFADLLHL